MASSLGGIGGRFGVTEPGLRPGLTGDRARINVRANEGAGSNAANAQGGSGENAAFSKGVTRAQSSITNLADTAARATERLAEIRASQLALAEEAASLPQGERTAALDAQYQELQEEANSITESASYNGIQVLQSGGAYAAGEGAPVISLPNNSSLAQDLGLSLTSPEDADAAASTLEGALNSTLISAQQAYSARSASEVEIKAAPEVGGSSSPERLSEDQATAIARRIASALIPEQDAALASEAKLVNALSQSSNLDPNRVKDLLS